MLPLFPWRITGEGTKSEVVSSPLPFWGPKVGWNCYVTPMPPGSPKGGDKIRSGYIHPAFSWAKVGGIAMQPLFPRGIPKMGTKSEVASSPLPFRGPKVDWNCYVTPVFSGSTKVRGQNQNWRQDACLPGGPKAGGIAT